MDKLSFHKFKKCVFVVTGGGGQSIASLLSIIPGASENILEVQIPYSKSFRDIFKSQSFESL